MRALLVVAVDFLPKEPFKVTTQEDEPPVEAFIRTVLIQRSANALALSDWTGASITPMPSEAKTSSKLEVHLESRSRMGNGTWWIGRRGRDHWPGCGLSR